MFCAVDHSCELGEDMGRLFGELLAQFLLVLIVEETRDTLQTLRLNKIVPRVTIAHCFIIYYSLL